MSVFLTAWEWHRNLRWPGLQVLSIWSDAQTSMLRVCAEMDRFFKRQSAKEQTDSPAVVDSAASKNWKLLANQNMQTWVSRQQLWIYSYRKMATITQNMSSACKRTRWMLKTFKASPTEAEKSLEAPFSIIIEFWIKVRNYIPNVKDYLYIFSSFQRRSPTRG